MIRPKTGKEPQSYSLFLLYAFFLFFSMESVRTDMPVRCAPKPEETGCRPKMLAETVLLWKKMPVWEEPCRDKKQAVWADVKNSSSRPCAISQASAVRECISNSSSASLSCKLYVWDIENPPLDSRRNGCRWEGSSVCVPLEYSISRQTAARR